jgi:hypothetical protein
VAEPRRTDITCAGKGPITVAKLIYSVIASLLVVALNVQLIRSYD